MFSNRIVHAQFTTMNQKRITNQILKQTNYTLNSTLNYLFNISNMKKLFSYLLISSMVVLSSCTNYDDQFDDLNTQINSLKSQIEGFSSLSSGLTSLQGTVASLQAAVASLPQTATPATDISGLEASVAALQAALSGAATSAEVAALTADLAATQAALDASIAANATATAAAQTALEAALATAQASNTTATDALAATLADLEAELATAATAAEVAEISTAIAANQAALVLAIGENATASANNSTDIADLAASLEALTATITELQATLATVSTAEEVADLAAALEAAQADLTAIIASSSFYEGNLSITTQDQLDFATSLGDKIKFIQGDLTIDQDTDEDMDAVQLTAVMAKVLNVTGDITYTSTETTTAKGAFTSLTGAGGVKIEQYGDISLPKLSTISGVNPGTTNDIELIGSTEGTLVVSLPALKHVEGDMIFTDLDAVTSFSMPVMEAFDGDITIEIDNDGTVDLSAFTNATDLDGTAVKNDDADALTVNAAELVAPVYAMGKITADRLVNVDLPLWQFAEDSSFQRAETAVLPSVTPKQGKTGYTIDAEKVFDDATSIHIIAAASTTATSPTHMSVTYDSSSLETLILGGTYATVSVKGTDVTSITFDGTAASVTVDSTDIETLDMPYTSAAKGTLVVMNNSKLTSLSADKVDGLAVFTLTGNSDLEDISFDALESASVAGAKVDIKENDLSIESYNEAIASPKTDKKIVSTDLAVLTPFLTDAIAKVASLKTNTVKVAVDDADIVRYYDETGEEDDVEEGSGVLANIAYLAYEDNAVPADTQVQEMAISGLSDGTDYVFKVDDEAISLLSGTALDDYYDVKNWANDAAVKAALATAGVTITNIEKGAKTATFDFTNITGSSISAITDIVLGFGGLKGDAVSVTFNAASDAADTATDLAAAINANDDGVISAYYTVEADGNKLVFTSKALGAKQRYDFKDLLLSAKVLSGDVEGSTPITFTEASVSVEKNEEAVNQAFVQFTANAPGTAGARTITLVGSVATFLNVSGLSTTANLRGDDEAITAASNSVDPTDDNQDEIDAVSINDVKYISAS